MEKMSLEELKTAMESLVVTLKCPVCLVLVDESLVLCVRGHAMCQKCKRDQQTCPTCKKAFSNLEQSTVLKQILEVVPHQCRFDKCTHLVKAGDDHELYCRFRSTRCQHTNCEWIGSVDNLSFHLEDKHPKEKVYSGTKSLVKISATVVGSKGTVMFSACGHYFWLKISACDKCFNKSFTYSPLWVTKPTRDINIRMRFQADGREYDTGMKLKLNDTSATFTIYWLLLSRFCDGDDLKYHLYMSEDRNETINILLE